MQYRRFVCALIVAAALIAPVQPSSADAPGSLYARMQAVNGNLKSYQADIHVDVKTNTFPFISPSLDGKAYFKQPDRNAVVFVTVPALANQFKKIYPQVELPSEWPKLYEVTPGTDDGTTAQFRLVRKKSGRIDHVDAVVDDRTATVSSMNYVYKDDGGSVRFAQNYEQLDGNYVIKSQTGKVDIPRYNADISSTFSNYKLNVAVDDKVFETGS